MTRPDVLLALAEAAAFIAAAAGVYGALTAGPARDEPWRDRAARALGRTIGTLIPARLIARLESAAARAQSGAREPELLRGLCVLLGLVLGGVGVLIGMLIGVALAPWVLAVMGGAAGAYIPVADLEREARKREAAILEELPWMVTLVSVATGGGASIDDALELYAARCDDPVLPAEIRRYVNDLELGISSTHAYRALLQRAPFPAMERVVSTFESGAGYGVSIKQSLDELMRHLDHEAQQRIEIAASAAQTRSAFPLTLCALAFTILLLAPFLAKMTQVWR